MIEVFSEPKQGLHLLEDKPIKRARAKVTTQNIRDFFVHYTQAMEGWPPKVSKIMTRQTSEDTPKSKKFSSKRGGSTVKKSRTL
jgi:1,2-phenylacetyl-CoA epoxidase PaaB subunit